MKIIKHIILVVVAFATTTFTFAQQWKRNNTWIIGSSPSLNFNFNNSFQIDTFNVSIGLNSGACISDTNGHFLLYTNSFLIGNKTGYPVLNGLNINRPKGNLFASVFNNGTYDQMSIILPKKGNQYYVFSTGMSDSFANELINNNNYLGFDVLNYSVVDMDSNNGNGKVIDKNHILLDNQHYAQTALTAVRHGNNKDWWLVKADCWKHQYQLFLVKEDTILGPYFHNIVDTTNFCELRYSQIYFSDDGTKFASNLYRKISPINSLSEYNKVNVYDFDRTTGQFSFRNHYEVECDTLNYPFEDAFTGIQFSPDGKLLYMSTLYSIFQIDINDNNPDNYIKIHGPDTTLDVFPSYHILANAVNGKMYIGNFDASQHYMSYIDKPNVKGLGCNFVKHGVWQPYTNLSNPPNMPNYGLGQWGTFPLSSQQITVSNEQLLVYPNPTSTKIVVRCQMLDVSKELFNSVGQLILSTKENEIDVSKMPIGLYYLKVGNQTKKIIVE